MKTKKKQDNWEIEFDREFTWKDDLGQKRFNWIMVEDYNPKDNIFKDEGIITKLKSFIRQLLAEEKAKYQFMSRKLAEIVKKESRKELIGEIEKKIAILMRNPSAEDDPIIEALNKLLQTLNQS